MENKFSQTHSVPPSVSQIVLFQNYMDGLMIRPTPKDSVINMKLSKTLTCRPQGNSSVLSILTFFLVPGSHNRKACRPQGLDAFNRKYLKLEVVHITIVMVLLNCRPVPRQSYDILRRGEANNILANEGFMFALRDCMRLSPKGLLFGGVPCNGFLD